MPISIADNEVLFSFGIRLALLLDIAGAGDRTDLAAAGGPGSHTAPTPGRAAKMTTAQIGEAVKGGEVSLDNIQAITADAQRIAADLDGFGRAPQRVHALVPRLIGHLEDRGAARGSSRVAKLTAGELERGVPRGRGVFRDPNVGWALAIPCFPSATVNDRLINAT